MRWKDDCASIVDTIWSRLDARKSCLKIRRYDCYPPNFAGKGHHCIPEERDGTCF